MPARYDLELAAREVSYEMNSLRESFDLAVAQRLRRLDTSGHLGAEERAFIESFAIRGIQARHFVDTSGTFGVPTDGEWLKALDVRLSHLSPHRLAYQTMPGWEQPVHIYKTLESAWAQFQEKLSSEERAWFSVSAPLVDVQAAVDRGATPTTSSAESHGHPHNDL